MIVIYKVFTKVELTIYFYRMNIIHVLINFKLNSISNKYLNIFIKYLILK